MVGKGIISELDTAFLECQSPNWDGYGAIPALTESRDLAERFLRSLPFGIEGPTVAVDPDGQLSLDWYRSPNVNLTVSIDPSGFYHYAAILDLERRSGRAMIAPDPPREIVELIREVTTS